MILTALNEYYRRLQDSNVADETLTPTVVDMGFSLQKITFVIVLDTNGNLLRFEDDRKQDSSDEKGNRRVPTLRIVPGGAKPTGPGLNACFLWDNSSYMLGFKSSDPKPERTIKSFAAFQQRHLALETEIDDPEFSAVCRFLERWRSENARDHPELADICSGFGVFRISGQIHFVHERPAVVRYWRLSLSQPRSETRVSAQCLVTGSTTRIARIHEPKIKGVLHSQSAGATLVSFNFDAAESYQKQQSFNAPVSEEVVFRYANGLNHLLRNGSRQRVQIGDATTIFWTAQPSPAEAILGLIFDQPVEDDKFQLELATLLQQITSGLCPSQLGNLQMQFYVLGLAPNAARIAVRFWHVSSIADVVARLHQHYTHLALDGRATWEPEFPSVRDILDQTARDRKDIPPFLAGALMRAIFDGSSYPNALYSAILRRIRSDRQINHVRTAVLKAHLNCNHQKGVSVSLDVNRKDAAYLLGRLFAALEIVQEDAIRGIKDTIRDRYFGAACASPRSVFPRLIRLKQHHLGRIKSSVLRRSHEERIRHIFAGFDDLPAQLGLHDQGLFAIGYYHQRNDIFMKKDRSEPPVADSNQE